MADMNDKIEVLNRFMGWTTGARCPECNERPTYRTPDDTWWDSNAHFWRIIPPFDPYADTPEAREWTRRLKDEFVRRTGKYTEVLSHVQPHGVMRFRVMIPPMRDLVRWSEIEHHAILDAIYEAIKP